MRIRTAELAYEGDGRYVARTGTGRTLAYGGDIERDEASPVESILTSLAGCTAMDVLPILEKKRQVIDRYVVEARAEQRDAYPQVLSVIELVHVIEGSVVLEAAVRRAIELSATKYCPINAMLSAGATEIHHRYRMRCTGLEPNEAEGEVVVTGPYRKPDVVA